MTQSYMQSLSPQALLQLAKQRVNLLSQQSSNPSPLIPTAWDDDRIPYVNRTTGKSYTPHNDEELNALNDDSTPNIIALGGEGSGKTTWLVIKVLERLRRGCSGIMGSPDLPHFSKSLWTEFQAWCPESKVIESHRYRFRPEWAPSHYFTINFTNGAELLCGGFRDPMSWEGGNLNFAAFDEVRRAPDSKMLKVLMGRARINGPHGEPPQLIFASTPRGGSPGEHWMFDHFGPEREEDPLASFKRSLRRLQLSTRDNASNLSVGYTEARSTALTDIEKIVYVDGGWGSVETGIPFLPSMSWWDMCLLPPLPALTRRDPLVLALDAGTEDDSFGAIALGLNTLRSHEWPQRYCVRWSREWIPPDGGLDTLAVQDEVIGFIKSWNVVKIVYDRDQLHHFMLEVKARADSFIEKFDQTTKRLIADKGLKDAIRTRDVGHMGDENLYRHIKNADRYLDVKDRMRIVKRAPSLKIDLAVCLSMAVHTAPEVL